MTYLIPIILQATLNVPYLWNGTNPLSGLDCSGLVWHVYKQIGIAPPSKLSSQELYNFYSQNGSQNVYRIGSLAFYGKSVTQIEHVAILYDDRFVVESGGGDHTTTTVEAAALKGAYVRYRPINRRGDLVAVVRPNALLAYP